MEIINLKAENWCKEKTELVCPHCGNHQRLVKSWAPNLKRNAVDIFQGTGDFQCGHCMENFSYRVEADLYFTSFKKSGIFK